MLLTLTEILEVFGGFVLNILSVVLFILGLWYLVSAVRDGVTFTPFEKVALCAFGVVLIDLWHQGVDRSIQKLKKREAEKAEG